MIVKTKCDIQKDLHYQVFSYLNELRSWGILPGDLKILSELYNYLFVLSNNNHIKDFKDKMNLLFSSEYKKEIMEKLGIMSVPILGVEGELLNFIKAVDWINDA